MSSINEIQDEIVSEFEILGDDRESTIFYIMELGGNLEGFPVEEQKEENIIKGCQSKVWLIADEIDGKDGVDTVLIFDEVINIDQMIKNIIKN